MSDRRPGWRSWLGGSVGILLLFAAVFVLRRQLQSTAPAEILADLRALPASRIWWAVGMTALAFATLTVYDVLALRWLRHHHPYREVAAAAATSYAFNHALGNPLITGAMVRSRFYPRWGFTAGEIARIVGFGSATSIVGLFPAAAIVCLLAPIPLPGWLPLPMSSTFPIGLLGLAGSIGYLWWCAIRRRPIRIWKVSLEVPTFRIARMQLAAGALDWLAPGLVLWAVLPPSLAISFSTLLAAFLVAQALANFSHVPGGLAVFEAAFVSVLPNSPPGSLLAATVAFRGVYLLLPLVIAAAFLAMRELRELAR